MADADRIAAALRYQQELDAAQRPATMNPNIAAQGVKARANMTPPESVMDPRYSAWKKSQDDAEAFMTAADLVGSAIPLAGPAVKGAAALGRYAGPELARGLEQHMMRTGGILPMDTWHGSPHRFPPTAKNPLGEFDASKIGTGEGAQAYGHGLYLAENRGVAKGYAEDLAKAGGNPLIIRKSGSVFKEGDALTSEILDALKYREKGLKDAGQFPHNTQYYARIAAEKIPNDAYRARVMNAINELEGTTHAYEKTKGNLYKVDLPDEQIAKMLDYDKPLSQQPKSVQAALSKYDADMYHPSGADYDPNETGQQIINRLAGTLAVRTPSPLSGQDLASQWLNNNGIPGIRYLDQGSRGASGTGKWKLNFQDGSNKIFDFKPNDDVLKMMGATAEPHGTSNFVVFDPKHMNIIGRE